MIQEVIRVHCTVIFAVISLKEITEGGGTAHELFSFFFLVP